MPPSSSIKPDPPQLTSLSQQQHSSPDEQVEGRLGRVSTPSNNSSFVSLDSLSDQTSETNLDSPSPRHYGTKLSPGCHASTLTHFLISIASSDKTPPRLELPLGHAAHAVLSHLLQLGALTGIAHPVNRGILSAASTEGEVEEAGRADESRWRDRSRWKSQTRGTTDLQSAATAVIWALKNTCVSGVQTQCLDIDLGQQDVESASRALLEDLGRWVLQKLRVEYDHEQAVFIVRMVSIFHNKSSHDIAECLLLQTRRAVGDTNVEAPRFTSCVLPLVLPAEHTQDESDEKLGGASRRNYYHPDAAIFDGKAFQPGLILELGWSHPTHRKRAKKYIRRAGGHVRCVLLLNVDHRKPKQRSQPDLLPPPGIFLTAFKIDADENSWGSSQFIDNWDLQANADQGQELDLPGNLISEHIPADVHVRVPLRTLVEKVDDALKFQHEADQLTSGAAVQQESSDVLGKRQRTESPDDDEEADYQPGGDKSPLRRTSPAVPVDSRRVVTRSRS